MILTYLLYLGFFEHTLGQQTCFGSPTVPSIAGRYKDNYNGTQIIDQYTWNSDGLPFHICSVDNDNREIYAQNDGSDLGFAWKYSRFEWVTVASDHSLWYCQQVYNANTLAEAESAPRADPSNPSAGGCGVPVNNFPWTQMIKFLKHKPSRDSNNGHQQTCFGSPKVPSIAGRYTDNWQGTQIIDQEIWNSSGLIFHLCEVSNEQREIYAQNDGNNGYNPWLYSRFEWVKEESSHTLWYCQQVYNATSLAEAKLAPRANPSSPSTGGCGASNFQWTQMIKVLKRPNTQPQTCFGSIKSPSIAGSYTDNYGGTQIVDRLRWNSSGLIFHLCEVHNAQTELYAQNDGTDQWNPWQYSRFEWTKVESSHTLWYCQQVYNATSIAQAKAAPRADSSNPSGGGCGVPVSNFPWTQMIKIHDRPKHRHAAGCRLSYGLDPGCESTSS